MKINELLKKGINILKEKNAGNSCVLDARVLLKYVLNFDDIGLVLCADKNIDNKTCEKYFKLIDTRAQGMPVQYITGNQEFMSLNFKVERGVLIPRNDTEILVEKIIDEVKKKSDNKTVSIIDIGTGTGCIAISLAYYIPNSIVYAIDISDSALKLAKVNAQKNNVLNRISFIKHNILDGFPYRELNEKVDVIVSNPPYIPTRMIDGLQKEVKDYELVEALDGADDGLLYYKKIIPQAWEFLISDGLLAFEVGKGQSTAVAEIINTQGQYKDIEIIKDLAGIERVIIARAK